MVKHFNYKDVKEEIISKFGSTGTTIRVFISDNDAPNFIMRRFEIQAGGQIGVHSHDWEHEMYVLSGEMFLIDDKGNKEKVAKDEFIYMPPNESHGYINESDAKVEFICLVPKSK